MTTIYELEKLATPGPLVAIHGKDTCFHEGNQDSLQWKAGTDGDEEVWETVAELWPTTRKSQAKADAKLLCHCRNNFLRALEALKEAQAMLYPPDNSIPTVKLVGTPQDMETLIKELEEI